VEEPGQERWRHPQLTLRCQWIASTSSRIGADLSTTPTPSLQCASREIVVLVSHEQHHGRPRGHVVHGLEDTHADSRVGFGVEYHDIGPGRAEKVPRSTQRGGGPDDPHAVLIREVRTERLTQHRLMVNDGDGFFDHLTHSEEPGITSSPG